MIPLGSCTMKLNATTEMEAVTWPEFADLHPFAPLDGRRRATSQLIDQLETWLAEVTGYDAVSLQPNAGCQGELAGLLAIRGYHRRRGDEQRDVCLIPSSARTAPTRRRAVMAGHAGRRRGLRRRRQRRPRRPARQDRRARRRSSPRSWSPTRRRTACTRTTIADICAARARRRRPGLRRRRQPQRAGRLRPASATSAATSAT